MIHARSWPEPHQVYGPALDLEEVGKLLGVTPNAVDVNLHRTRATPERVRVRFPEPDGVATRDGVTTRYWWSTRIERYKEARRRAGGSRRQLTDADIERIRRMAIDGNGVSDIARTTGWSIATISRIVNGKTHLERK